MAQTQAQGQTDQQPPTRRIKYRRPLLYPLQEEAIFYPRDKFGNLARYSFIEAGTKTGKTVGSIAWIFEQAMLGKRGWNHWWVAPISGQAEIAFRRMKSFVRGVPSKLGPMRIFAPSGGVIWFKSADNPDSLYGEDVYSAVIDEASRTSREAFIAVRSTLTATRGPLRSIGNVKGRRNWFYDLARKAEKGDAPGMARYKITAWDAVNAGVLDAGEIEDARRVMPEEEWRQLYLAEAADDSGCPFGKDAQIEQCVAPIIDSRPVWWGWDLAKSVDFTVGIALDINGRTCRLERFQHVPWKETIDTIRRVTGRTAALVDSTGLGDPVLDALQRDGGSNFEGYKFSQASKQKLMEGLAVAIQRSEISFPPGPVEQEVKTFEYEYTRTGVRYSAPEGAHDDCVCALALANEHRTSKNALASWTRLAQQVSPN